jgi:hypothetical protein
MPQRVEPYTKLLIHGDGLVDDYVIKDQCGNSITNTSVTLSATQKKFGKYSMYFTGTSYITLPNINLGSGDWTISYWIYWNSASTYKTVFMLGGFSAGTTIGVQSGNGTVNQIVYVGGTAKFTESGSPTTATWYHYAIVKSGSTITMYRNGTSVGSASDSTNFATTQYNAIGYDVQSSAYPLPAYMTDFQIVVGKAIWTSAFTPPDYSPKGRKGWY